MRELGTLTSALFDVLLAPFGHDLPAWDLLVWPAVMGLGALPVYKLVSNQRAIAAVKRKISMHLLEIRLFNFDMLRVLRATAQIVFANTVYVAHNLLPVAVLMAPMMLIMTQLVAHYGYTPDPVGSVRVLQAELEAGAGPVSLVLPEGVELDAPMVRTASGRVYWRLKAKSAGDHRLEVTVGDHVFAKHWSVGGEARKVAVKRLKGLEALLYPGEEALPSDAPVRSIALPANTRSLDFLPDGELGVLAWSMVLSLVVGFACKGLFGVVL